MTTAEAVAGVLLLALTAYAVFAGADFGAGIWALLAGRRRGPRELVDRAIGPVWEANHVWLIFALVLTWTGFPAAFQAVMSTLFIPLCLVALGIVLRGAGFAFQRVAARTAGRRLAERAFGISSVLTPLMIGAVVGGVISGRVPTGNAQGDPLTSWVNPVSLVIAALFLATCAYLAAVFLVHDAVRFGVGELERYFAARARVAAAVAGLVAIGALFVLHADAPRTVWDGLTSDGLPFVVASAVCGGAALILIWREVRRGTRVLAAGAVVGLVWGGAAATYPYLLPTSLTIAAGAGASATLRALLVVAAAALLFVVPALAFLFILDQRSLLEEEVERGRHEPPDRPAVARTARGSG